MPSHRHRNRYEQIDHPLRLDFFDKLPIRRRASVESLLVAMKTSVDYRNLPAPAPSCLPRFDRDLPSPPASPTTPPPLPHPCTRPAPTVRAAIVSEAPTRRPQRPSAALEKGPKRPIPPRHVAGLARSSIPTRRTTDRVRLVVHRNAPSRQKLIAPRNRVLDRERAQGAAVLVRSQGTNRRRGGGRAIYPRDQRRRIAVFRDLVR